ncbi:MAG TPA: hypothetical protein VK524_08210 [Polyangiaceae bacterium]|nr:hypothetical protein [Polyangiaceae bacterium]
MDIDEAYHYDEPQPHTLSRDGTNTYHFDGSGNRIEKSGPADTTHYVYTPFEKLERAWVADSAGSHDLAAYQYDAFTSRVRRESAEGTTIYGSGLYERRDNVGSRPTDHIYRVPRRRAQSLFLRVQQSTAVCGSSGYAAADACSECVFTEGSTVTVVLPPRFEFSGPLTARSSHFSNQNPFPVSPLQTNGPDPADAARAAHEAEVLAAHMGPLGAGATASMPSPLS